jgi:hypothetical protein
MGTEAQAQHKSERASEQSNVSVFPPLFNEIRVLQERLLYLEDQATQQWKATVEDPRPKDSNSGQKSTTSNSEDDEVLRKYIRKAPSGSRQVETIEQLADETADERKTYGQNPNEARVGEAKTTMYHIQKSGDLYPGNEFEAVTGEKGWLDTYGQVFPGFSHGHEAEFRQRDKPLPHRGVRPPAAMHPFYQAPIRKPGTSVPASRRKEWQRFGPQPLKLSRKLGPPTRWDESDLEEWSSDTSTRSQDFKYFRSRLRGDFEWELDRLNSQVLRFRKHKDKKSRQLATKARKDNERRDEEFGAYEEHGELMAKLKLDAKAAGEDNHGIRQLNPMGWSVFRLRRALPLQYSLVIDVLIEEPKLSSDLELWGRVNRDKKDRKTHKTSTNLRTSAAEDMNSKDDTARISKNSMPWTAEEPLPERIRINSKQIIDILSNIHGSPLHPEADEISSVALLRPFKILIAYDKQIREACSTLETEASKESDISTSVTENEMQ